MERRIEAPALCRACERQRRKEERLGAKEETVRLDPMRARSEALRRARGCLHFTHHSMYTPDGKEDPLMGQRTCSLTVQCGCGHEKKRYNLCAKWFDGRECVDWAPKT